MAGACQNLADAVHAHAPSSSGWKAIFQSSAEGLVHRLSFLITVLLVGLLFREPFLLLDRVVQLFIGVYNLLASNKQFKSASYRPTLIYREECHISPHDIDSMFLT